MERGALKEIVLSNKFGNGAHITLVDDEDYPLIAHLAWWADRHRRTILCKNNK